MKKIIILSMVLLISVISVGSAFAVTGPPPPPPKMKNCIEIVVDDAFNAKYPPPMGLTTFAACWATPASKQVCFETPLGGYNFNIRYWQFFRGRWHEGHWTTINAPTTFSHGDYCVNPVPGLQIYGIQGIALGPGTWGGNE